jgi:hypothetical protein
MGENDMEIHPFKRFPENSNSARYLILGSFPPSKFTINPQKLTENDCKFFYGSKDNSFWDLFIENLKLKIEFPNDLKKLKEWIELNCWVISDIILKTKRKKDSASDNDLQPIEWNNKIIDNILEENSIKVVLYTSNWVKDSFQKKVKPLLKSKNINYVEFTSISPSPAGLISLNWAKLILPTKDNESNSNYRKRYYKWLFDQIVNIK